MSQFNAGKNPPWAREARKCVHGFILFLQVLDHGENNIFLNVRWLVLPGVILTVVRSIAVKFVLCLSWSAWHSYGW